MHRAQDSHDNNSKAGVYKPGCISPRLDLPVLCTVPVPPRVWVKSNQSAPPPALILFSPQRWPTHSLLVCTDNPLSPRTLHCAPPSRLHAVPQDTDALTACAHIHPSLSPHPPLRSPFPLARSFTETDALTACAHIHPSPLPPLFLRDAAPEDAHSQHNAALHAKAKSLRIAIEAIYCEYHVRDHGQHCMRAGEARRYRAWTGQTEVSTGATHAERTDSSALVLVLSLCVARIRAFFAAACLHLCAAHCQAGKSCNLSARTRTSFCTRENPGGA